MIKRILRSNIRFKLVVSLLSIVFLAGALSTVVGLGVINKNIIREASDAVRTSLAATSELYHEEIENRSRIIRHLAGTPEIVRATARRDRAFLFEKLVQIREEFEFDIVNVVTGDGTILVRANNFEAFGDSMAGYRTIQDVRRTRTTSAGTGVLDFENIAREGPELAERTTIKVIPTSRLRPPPSPVEDRAMVIKIAVPILSGERLEGILYAAILLNNNFRFIDRFKRLVFKEERIGGVEVGTTTLFLGDIRVATNVVDSTGRRAIGTQVSDEVYERVVVEGRDWLGEAMVVGRWYISGYTPIYDFDGRILGMLYNGLLKEKFDIIVRNTTLSFLLVILLATVLALALSVYLINLYTKPVKRIIDASTEMARGFYDRIEIDPRDDEDARNLARAFNGMVDAIEERDQRLKAQAEQTILKSEKLASIGRLASGIAHEINNPLTGVLTYSSLLLKDLKDTRHGEDLKVIRDETLRCRTIVQGILNFAREDKPEKSLADINAIIEESLKILERHVSFQNIEIVKELDPAVPLINVNGGEVRAVINNLAMNAADAMPDGGRMTIATGADEGAGVVIVTVRDTGIGISKENIGKIFDPFFTTKEKGKGTGLGLAMVYGVIARHGGTIDVRSEVGQGAEFRIRLPLR